MPGAGADSHIYRGLEASAGETHVHTTGGSTAVDNQGTPGETADVFGRGTFKQPHNSRVLDSETHILQRELFLYDRVLFSTSGTVLDNVNLQAIPAAYEPDPFPNTLADQKSLKAWQTLFRERRDWANAVLDRCQTMRVEAEALITQRNVIEKGLRIAIGSLENPLGTLEKRLSEIGNGLQDTSDETRNKSELLDEDLARLAGIPALMQFSKFFVGHGASGRGRANRKSVGTEGKTTLAAFVDKESARAAVPESNTLFTKFATQVKDFGVSLNNLNLQLEELKRGLDVTQSRSLTDDGQEPEKLMGEIEATTEKITMDCTNIFNLRNDPKSAAQASRVALLHTKDFLPGLMECAVEMNDVLRRNVDQKNSAVVRAADILQMVAGIETQQNTLKHGVDSLKMTDEDWGIVDRISLASDIPSIYGSILIESIRRGEWTEKMRRDSANLAEEMAGYQEEEQKRRKKWLRNMKDFVPERSDGTLLGLEINLQGGDIGHWPEATRQDLEDYVKALQRADGTEETVQYLEEMVRDMDKPTRQQVKRAKAFKNGSVHEAGFGKGSLLLRGEDEGRIMKEVVNKLEEEARGYKSRIRKLEDLLHRQSQLSRISMAQAASISHPEDGGHGDFGGRSPSSASYRPDQMLRRPSTPSRRVSANLSPEERANARRLLQLESELAEERQAKASLQQEVEARDTEIARIMEQMKEAESTKRDIMENMDSRQREFADERKALEEERDRQKTRAEELEDDLDRAANSRERLESDRAGTERKLDQLSDELDQTRRGHTDKITEFENEIQEREARIARADQDFREFLATLINAMAPEGKRKPREGDREEADDEGETETARLMADLDEIVQRSLDQTNELNRAVAMARSENENLQSSLDAQRAEVASLGMKLDAREADMMKAQDILESEKAKAASYQSQLEEERKHVHDLRDRFADGETGSEALRKRLSDEETKVTKLSTRLAQTQSHNNSLDVELMALQTRYKTLQAAAQASSARLEARGQRAKEVTQRLYTLHIRLHRLLEALGFLVTYDERGMTIQRASRAGSGSTILPDQSVATLGGQSTVTVGRKFFDEESDLSSLLWMERSSTAVLSSSSSTTSLSENHHQHQQDDRRELQKFTEFIAKTDRFSIEQFCEAVYKRQRDMEHTARKWQREARAYREKARKTQGESQDKIAFRAFKEGDLALFLPTRKTHADGIKPWAAFNVGAPHYFLKEREGHRLGNKEWLVARINKVEERIVDLSKRMTSSTKVAASDGGEDDAPDAEVDEDNPFELSDGLRWYLLDAQEEKPGAPTGPAGPAKSTVAAVTLVDAKGSVAIGQASKSPVPSAVATFVTANAGFDGDASKQLSRSLDSRRSSIGSKHSARGLAAAWGIVRNKGSHERLEGGSPGSGSARGPSHLRTRSDADGLLVVGSPSSGRSLLRNHENVDDIIAGPNPMVIQDDTSAATSEAPTPDRSKDKDKKSKNKDRAQDDNVEDEQDQEEVRTDQLWGP
jgi:autophagy-related protein 11